MKVDKSETELRRFRLHEHWYTDRNEFEQKVGDLEEKVDYWKQVLADLGSSLVSCSLEEGPFYGLPVIEFESVDNSSFWIFDLIGLSGCIGITSKKSNQIIGIQYCHSFVRSKREISVPLDLISMAAFSNSSSFNLPANSFNGFFLTISVIRFIRAVKLSPSFFS